jgi:hypothetical protein
VPRVRRCVGDPPRQTEDSQSPPCVAYWSGDNGGATTKGVTADEIRIVSYTGDERADADLEAFFNRRFEFYGRKLSIIAGPDAGANCQERRANAQDVDTRIQPFASLDPVAAANNCYYDELARRNVIGIIGDPQLSEETLAARRPYLWQYSMAYDREFAMLGRWACARLAGRNAVHAADATFHTRERVFGVILQSDVTPFGYDITPLREELERCGVKLAAEYLQEYDGSGEEARGDAAQAQNAVIRMKTSGVTTVFCLCIPGDQQYVTAGATAQDYHPEWIVTSVFFNDYDFWFHAFWAGEDQRQSVFGLTFRPRQTAYADQPVTQALKEVDPGWEWTNSFQFVNIQAKYQQLLMLASGIQMAGPNLTPETFETAMHETVFPNPDLPIHEGAVGFGNGSYAATLDAAEMWYSPTAPSPFPELGLGTWCYVDAGVRHRIDEWRRDEPDELFQAPCQ